MTQIAATDVAKNFGEWHEKAMQEPVIITKHGRESAVLMSIESYRKLIDGYREIVPVEELDAVVAGGIEESEIPEEYRWHSSDENVSDKRRGAGD